MRMRLFDFIVVWRLAGAAILCMPFLASGADRASGQAPVLQDPHYGDGLFHFYQTRYFTSITSLMVSQHFERMPHHADEAEILRGGLLLSYGLHREAGEIFAKLIEKGASPPVRDRAWFYLAKIRYQRGFLAEATEALGRIDKYLPADLQEERVLLDANVRMALGDYAGAVSILEGAAKGKGAGLYAQYNLGVALVRNGDFTGGSAQLEAVGRLPATRDAARGMADEEFLSLRDKANVALGFAALQDQRPEDARTFLQRVRLNGAQSNKALLGFGWAAAALSAPQKALVPWTELAQRESSDAAVLEARIAVPYALAELKAYGQSLARYTEAIHDFDREGVALDESVAAIREGKLLEGLLENNPGEEMGWFWTIRQLPAMPHAGHLTPLLAEHQFQEAFKNYRDLHFLDRNLHQWADSLGVFHDMLANRRVAYAERLPKVLAQAGQTYLGTARQQRDGLAAELAQAERVADGVAFANARERDLLARRESVQAALARHGDDPEAAGARDRHRLASGALVWQLAQAYPGRVWDAKKAMRSVDAGLDEATRRESALAQAQRDEPARFEQFAQRIAALQGRLQGLIPRVAALTREQQGVVQDLAVAELVRQKERLAEYTTQARFAVAQLYDRATASRSHDDAPAR